MRYFVFIMGLLVVAGCSDQKGSTPSSDLQTSEVPAEKLEIPIDDALMADLVQLLEICELRVKKNTYLSCPRNVTFDLYQKFKKGPTGISLATLAVALAGSDKNLSVAAAEILGSFYWDGPHVRGASKPVSALLREALLKLDTEQRKQVLRVVVAASFRSGDEDAIDGVLEQLTDSALKTHGWAVASEFDRAKYLSKIKATTDAVITAALKVGDYGVIRNDDDVSTYSDKDKEVLCGWALGYLEMRLPNNTTLFSQRQYRAGNILIKCGGEWIDKLLNWLDTRSKANVFDGTSRNLQASVCDHELFNSASVPFQGTKEQCARNDALLERVIGNDSMPVKARKQALLVRVKNRNDTAKLLTQYRDGSDEFAVVAREVLATQAGKSDMVEDSATE